MSVRTSQWMTERPFRKKAAPSHAARFGVLSRTKRTKRLEEDRNPAGEQVRKVRHLAEAIRHEGEGDSRDPRRSRRARERAGEPERPVSREREAEEHREAVHGQRAHAEGEERKERQRDAVVVLAEGEAVLHREEDVAVEEVEGIVKRLVKIPPESPRHEIGISGVRAVIAHDGEPTATS